MFNLFNLLHKATRKHRGVISCAKEYEPPLMRCVHTYVLKDIFPPGLQPVVRSCSDCLKLSMLLCSLEGLSHGASLQNCRFTVGQRGKESLGWRWCYMCRSDARHHPLSCSIIKPLWPWLISWSHFWELWARVRCMVHVNRITQPETLTCIRSQGRWKDLKLGRWLPDWLPAEAG